MEGAEKKSVPSALTIAGFDPGSGAGIMADIKTFSILGVYGTSVVTALTAQNHEKFLKLEPVGTEMIISQFKAVYSGYEIDAVKIGLVPNEDVANLVAEYIAKLNNPNVVTDPVFSATSGMNFAGKKIEEIYMETLIPLSRLVTPNLDELSRLTGMRIGNADDLEESAKRLFDKCGTSVLAKGGHLKKSALDILVSEKGVERFETELVPDINTHGSGCILSSAVCAYIASGYGLEEAVLNAKIFMNTLLESGTVIRRAGKILEPGSLLSGSKPER